MGERKQETRSRGVGHCPFIWDCLIALNRELSFILMLSASDLSVRMVISMSRLPNTEAPPNAIVTCW
jgi:hypothetical protein